jgi:hypothetical protein
MKIHEHQNSSLPPELAQAAEVELTADVYHNARSRGLDLTQWLEEMNPSQPGEALDAFERQLALAGIRISGPGADVIDRFFSSSENAVLFPEYVSRSIKAGMQDFRKLDAVLATRTRIDDNTYRTIFMDDSVLSESDLQLAKVGEGAELPRIEIATSTHTLTLYKYGRYIEASYEAIRRKKAPVVAVFLRSIGMQIQKDKFDSALSVLINGDGNSNAASITNVAVDDTLSYSDLLSFCLAFDPYEMNVMITNSTVAASLLNLTEFKDPALAAPLQERGEMITPFGAKLLVDDGVPASTIIGLDKRYALEEVYETGILTETDRLIRQQLEGTAISEVSGFAKLVKSASRVLNIDLS